MTDVDATPFAQGTSLLIGTHEARSHHLGKASDGLGVEASVFASGRWAGKSPELRGLTTASGIPAATKRAP